MPLLQKSGIREAKGFGGFPVGGAFLRRRSAGADRRRTGPRCTACRAGAPPMAGTHLDARVINGKSWLVFGPFAGWSPKFLKQGKVTDLPLSVRPNNLASIGQGRAHAGCVWCAT